MSKLVLTNVRLFANAADLTAASNKAELQASVEAKEVTNYASAGWKEYLGGLGSGAVDAEGQWEAFDASKVDDSRWADLGGVGPWSICPAGAAVTAPAYLTKALETSYALLGQVGDVAPWKAAASSAWPLAQGQVANAPGSALTVTGVGTAIQLGAVPAGKQLYSNLHVLSVAGTAAPTITARIESDNAVGFPSPATQITFAAATAAGGQALRAAGAITDDWFRAAWTISGTNPSFLALIAFGIH
jgi:hypothetical protein